ncbi:MAG TPA: right-handed parallel beta-helix repeat-containing protein [Polyangiaceae bacterium]
MRRVAPLLALPVVVAVFSCGSSSGGSSPSLDASTDSTASSSGAASSSSGTGSSGGSLADSSGSSGGPDASAHPDSSSSPDSSSPDSSGSDSPADATVPINPDAFYVSTTGDDTNPGTLAKPFLTLGQAQKAMQASKTSKTTYVRAGTYEPTASGGSCVWGDASGSSIGLSSADAGETWSFYPPDGYGSAILDGQSTTGGSGGTGGNGTGCAFGASQMANVTIVGLQFQHYLYSAFWGWAVSGLTFEDNVVHDTTAASFSAGAVYLVASPGALVANNYVHDVAYMGIVVSDNSTNGDSMSNSTVSGNVVLDACTYPAAPGGNDQDGGDCGGIYFWSQATTASTNLRITNNYVRDVNAASKGAGDFGTCCTVGIYLDDGTNNVTASGNVVTGSTSSCFMIHGGQNNVFTGNLCDLGSTGAGVILRYQDDSLTTMTGNSFEHNVVVAGSSAAGGGYAGSNSPPNPMTIADNAYFNYVGTSVDSTGSGGVGSDASPTYESSGVTCWSPLLPPASLVMAAPVSFPGIAGEFGPPGFTMPQTGTAPSWPHGC